MASSLCILLLLLALAVLVPGACSQSTNVQTWQVDLDQPPASRWPWSDMIKVYGPAIVAVQALIGQFVPKPLQGMVEHLAEVWHFYAVPEITVQDFIDRLGPYGLEIKSAAVQFNFSLGEAILLNYIYEAEAGCTSIIARTPSGQLLHGRNLDFNLAGTLQNLTCQVQFLRGGQILYSATTFAGYIGVLTGVRNGIFSITVDQRQKGTLIGNLIELFNKNATGVAIVVRDMMENAETFADAVAGLSSLPIIAPVYYIVSGVSGNDAAIITRDRDSAANVWYMNSTVWYLVETNYDHWLPDPPKDDRRTIAEEALDQVGSSNINLSALYKVLSVPMVLNSGTTYTAVIVPANGTLITVAR